MAETTSGVGDAVADGVRAEGAHDDEGDPWVAPGSGGDGDRRRGPGCRRASRARSRFAWWGIRRCRGGRGGRGRRPAGCRRWWWLTKRRRAGEPSARVRKGVAAKAMSMASQAASRRSGVGHQAVMRNCCCWRRSSWALVASAAVRAMRVEALGMVRLAEAATTMRVGWMAAARVAATRAGVSPRWCGGRRVGRRRGDRRVGRVGGPGEGGGRAGLTAAVRVGVTGSGSQSGA